MRLWSIHPKHLDWQGLVALWRESLLAQKVLRGYSFDRSRIAKTGTPPLIHVGAGQVEY